MGFKSEICERVDNNQRAIMLNESTKILGLLWNTASDSFQYRVKINVNECKNVTY